MANGIPGSIFSSPLSPKLFLVERTGGVLANRVSDTNRDANPVLISVYIYPCHVRLPRLFFDAKGGCITSDDVYRKGPGDAMPSKRVLAQGEGRCISGF